MTNSLFGFMTSNIPIIRYSIYDILLFELHLVGHVTNDVPVQSLGVRKVREGHGNEWVALEPFSEPRVVESFFDRDAFGRVERQESQNQIFTTWRNKTFILLSCHEFDFFEWSPCAL